MTKIQTTEVPTRDLERRRDQIRELSKRLEAVRLLLNANRADMAHLMELARIEGSLDAQADLLDIMT